MSTDTTIQLDLKHRAIRSGQRWAIQKLQPDGSYDMTAFWDGSRRSLFQWMEQNEVHPSRRAEIELSRLPESAGFRER